MTDEVLTDKAQILARMAESRRALQAALDRAGPEVIQRPGSWGEWSLKDLLAHIVYWQTVAIDRLGKFADGRADEIARLSGDDEMNQVNENVYQSNRDRPLAEMMKLFTTTYQTLRTAVKSIPAEVYARPVAEGAVSAADTVRGDGYGHDAEHLADVEAAIQRQ